jgi:hypothetical protein
MSVSSDNEALPGFLFRLIGYGLLVLSFFNLVDILVPLQLMNPAWEFQTVGAIVESSPIPLMGLAFVFYGKLENRYRWELFVLNWLSWSALMVAILSFLLVPLGVSSATWTNRQNHYRLNTQSDEQIAQLQKLQTQLNQATDTQLQGLLKQVSAQAADPDIKTPQDLKARLQNDLTQAEKASRQQVETQHNTKRFSLFKSAAKWGIGAIISGCLFLQIWRYTSWARVSVKRKSGW